MENGPVPEYVFRVGFISQKPMLILISKTTIIGIIITIAVVSISAAVAIYLASTAEKGEEKSGSPKDK